MNPTVSYQLVNALIAERHHHAERDRTAPAALQASRARAEHASKPMASVVARVLTRRARLARRRMA